MDILQQGNNDPSSSFQCDPDCNSCTPGFEREGNNDHYNVSQAGYSSYSSSVSSMKSTSSPPSSETSTKDSSESGSDVKTDSSGVSSVAPESTSFQTMDEIQKNQGLTLPSDTSLLAKEWMRQLNLKLRGLNIRLESQRNILSSLSCQVSNDGNSVTDRIFYLQVSNFTPVSQLISNTCITFRVYWISNGWIWSHWRNCLVSLKQAQRRCKERIPWIIVVFHHDLSGWWLLSQSLHQSCILSSCCHLEWNEVKWSSKDILNKDIHICLMTWLSQLEYPPNRMNKCIPWASWIKSSWGDDWSCRTL